MTYFAYALLLAVCILFRDIIVNAFQMALADGSDGSNSTYSPDEEDDKKPDLCRHKGGGRPRRDRRAERMQRQLMQAQLRQARRRIRMPHIPIPEPPPPPPPPPSQTSSDVLDAEQLARRQSKKRTNTGNGTLFAGETGLGGKKTLLG